MKTDETQQLQSPQRNQQADINHFVGDNGIKLSYVLTPQNQCDASNLLSPDDHKLWLSSKRQNVFPHTI